MDSASGAVKQSLEVTELIDTYLVRITSIF